MECKNGMEPAVEYNSLLGMNLRRCPEEEVEDLCKDIPELPVSVNIKNVENNNNDDHTCVLAGWCTFHHMNLVDNNKRCECEGELEHKANLNNLGIGGPSPRTHVCVLDST